MPKIVFKNIQILKIVCMVKMCEFWFIKPNLLLKELHNNFLIKVIFVCRLYVFFSAMKTTYINGIFISYDLMEYIFLTQIWYNIAINDY